MCRSIPIAQLNSFTSVLMDTYIAQLNGFVRVYRYLLLVTKKKLRTIWSVQDNLSPYNVSKYMQRIGRWCYRDGQGRARK